MTLNNANLLVELLENHGFEASVYENYSGRFMYGEKTAGVVVTDLTNVIDVLIRAVTDEVDPGFDAESYTRYDSMGLDVILY